MKQQQKPKTIVLDKKDYKWLDKNIIAEVKQQTALAIFTDLINMRIDSRDFKKLAKKFLSEAEIKKLEKRK